MKTSKDLTKDGVTQAIQKEELLKKTNWKKYPEKMLKYRAQAIAICETQNNKEDLK